MSENSIRGFLFHKNSEIVRKYGLFTFNESLTMTIWPGNPGHGGISWITVCVVWHLTKEMNHVQAWKCYSVFQEQSRSLFQVSKSPLFLLESAANNSALKFRWKKGLTKHDFTTENSYTPCVDVKMPENERKMSENCYGISVQKFLRKIQNF